MTLHPTALTKVCNVCGGTYSYDEAHSCTQGNTKLFMEDQPAPLLDPDALIGATLGGRYRIEECLSGGGMGVVYRARQLVLDRSVAIKIMVVREPQEDASRQRFLQEAILASRVRHSNVIETFDFGVLDGGHLYLVMEYLEGQTLRQALGGGPMAPERACRIALQISRGLQAVHDEGIVHRDLKPDNVFLVKRDGQKDFVKIVDFGVAKGRTSPNLTQAGMVLGTPQYMSPEQVDGKEPDHRVDQYALGCVLYRMLTGALPFDGESTSDILVKHAVETAVPPRSRRPDQGITVSLDRVVMRMLAKRPDSRYPNMRELELVLLREIDQLRRPEVSHATRLMSLPEPKPSRGRLAIFTGLGAGVALVGLILYAGRGESERPSNRERRLPSASTTTHREMVAKRIAPKEVESGPSCRQPAPRWTRLSEGFGGDAVESSESPPANLWSSAPKAQPAMAPQQMFGLQHHTEVQKVGVAQSIKVQARSPQILARPRPIRVQFKVENREDIQVTVACTGKSPFPCMTICTLEVPDGKGMCVASAPGSGYQPLSFSFDELRGLARGQKSSVTQPLRLQYIRYQ